jgi:hypothetical protein
MVGGWWLCWKKAERNVGVEVGVVVEGGKRGRGFQVMWELEGVEIHLKLQQQGAMI